MFPVSTEEYLQVYTNSDMKDLLQELEDLTPATMSNMGSVSTVLVCSLIPFNKCIPSHNTF